MCGRFTLRAMPQLVAAQFGLSEIPLFEPHYNIAPTQLVLAVRADQTGNREAAQLRWGLIPSWADDPAIGNRMINARSETVASKPAFRHAFRHKRCLVVADGFYEWKATGGKKQPFYIRMRDERPFGFAGLWESWNKGEQPVESCTILTTEANNLMRPLHDRMPVILDSKDYGVWLDTAMQEPKTLEPLLGPCRAEEMTAYPVSTLVNSPRNDSARCVEPVVVEGQADIFG
jgi:putative SOS response-associated peptidase YedK